MAGHSKWANIQHRKGKADKAKAKLFSKLAKEITVAAKTGMADVKITNLDNPKTLDAFKTGQVDGAWLPEPWSSRLVLDAGAKVLLDEKTLWPNGKFPTTVIIVRSEFLQRYPQTVQAILRGHIKAIDWAKSNEADAKTTVNAALKELSGSTLSQPAPPPALQPPPPAVGSSMHALEQPSPLVVLPSSHCSPSSSTASPHFGYLISATMHTSSRFQPPPRAL